MSKFRNQHMVFDWINIIGEEDYLPAAEAPLKEKATLVGRVGSMMLSVGTSAWRVRASMNKIARALNMVCNADISLLTIEYTCSEKGETSSGIISLRTTGVNTDKLYSLKQFTNGFSERAQRYSVIQFHRILDKIEELPANYKAWNLALAAALACGAFTFLLGGGLVEMILAFCGAGVGQYVRKKLLERRITLLANVCLGVAASCCTYVILMKLGELCFGIQSAHEAGYICSMLFVIPGFPLITGGIDLAKLELRSGAERIMYALLIIFMATITGWVTASVFGFAPGELVPPQMSPAVLFVCRMLASFCGVYGFSFLFNSKRKMAVMAGLIGMTANVFRLSLLDYAGLEPALAAFLGALTAGLLASAIRIHIGYPRIAITVPSIVIMVPGMYMYKAIYYLAFGEDAQGGYWLIRAVLIVAALPLGLIFARILTDTNFRKSS